MHDLTFFLLSVHSLKNFDGCHWQNLCPFPKVNQKFSNLFGMEQMSKATWTKTCILPEFLLCKRRRRKKEFIGSLSETFAAVWKQGLIISGIKHSINVIQLGKDQIQKLRDEIWSESVETRQPLLFRLLKTVLFYERKEIIFDFCQSIFGNKLIASLAIKLCLL